MVNFKKISEKVIGSVNIKNHPEWRTKKNIQNWLRKLRSRKTIR